ncbi:MAG: CoA-binding protein [Sphingobacteriaceae bacterium]
MMPKKTIVLGASNNPGRYAYLAAVRLVSHNHPIINVGIKTGEAAGVAIERPEQIHSDVDTITMYVGLANQPIYYDYILKTHPKRIIFNPGAENPELAGMAEEQGIETMEACTLVLLATNQY